MSMKKQSGFTLIELMLTIVIAAVLLGIAAPSMRHMIQNGRIVTVTNELISSLQVARSEAIRQAAFACVCPSTDVTVATPACSNSSSWETGWIAFLDYNGNCTIETAAPPVDVLLKVWDGSQYGSELTVRNSDASINLFNTIRFNSRGETQQANGALQQGTFRICDSRGIVLDNNNSSTTASAVVISASGNARATRISAQVSACP